MTSEMCRHCGYSIPHDSSICPGCGRRHSPAEAAFARLPAVSREHSPLPRNARHARHAIFVTGWLAIVCGLAGLAHTAVYLDRVTDELPDDAPGRVTDVANGFAIATLAALAVVAVATAAWTARTRRNVRALGLADRSWSAWSLGGWLLPGKEARQRKRLVDARWRDTSPVISALPRHGASRQPVSQVVVRWWALWAWVPAVVVLLVIVGGPGFEPDDRTPELGLATMASAALLVAALRSLYDVIGVVTVAHAHRIADGDRPRPARRWVDAQLDQEELAAVVTATSRGARTG